MILKTLVLGPLATNCYIVGSEKTGEAMVIDPADNAEAILNHAAQLKLEVKLILLTHAHVDHIGALKEVKDTTGASVAIHEEDAPLLKTNASRGFMGLSYPVPPEPDRLLKHRDTINVGNLNFTVLHTPGHTRGSISLYGEGAVFSGDTLFNGGIGRTDFAGGSYRDIMNSIKSYLLPLPDETIVYPGHGPDSTIGDEREENPFLE
ncbi:MAG: MBL fold metallo-hydrolase [Chloroflexota bacterium]